jgi:cytohesin
VKANRTFFATIIAFSGLVLTLQLGRSQQQKFSGDFDFALMSGNVEEVRQFIQKDPKFINQNPRGAMTPLVEAAQLGKYEMVELFVTNNADINAHGVWGYTALHFAASRGDAKMVEFLVKHKADVNARSNDGLTPIILAIRSAEVIKLLLANGADINAHDGNNTVLSQAVGHPENTGAGVVELLLANGADVTISEDEGFFQAVLFHDDTNVIKLLVPYYANSTNPAAQKLLRGALEIALDRNRTKMASAILSASIQLQTNLLQKTVVIGNVAAIRSLLATNPTSVNSRDFLGWTPLHLAAAAGQTAIAEILLSNQADVDSQDDIGNTPLHWAAFFGHSDLVELFLRHKANMDVKGNTEFNMLGDGGDTPLDFAIQQGFTSIATMLITNGANLGPHKFYGETPLHIATSKENVELMKLLLARGANVNACMQASWTSPESSLDIAVRGNSPEAVRLLIDSGASVQTKLRTHSGTNTTLLHLWAEQGNTNIADQLLAAGCDVNAKDGDGQTPLHIAVGQWHLTYKADPNITNTDRKWPSDFIVEDSGKEAALWLLNHKADVNAKEKNGQTPLHLVVTRGNIKAIQCLLDYKADVNATDTNGKTPLALLEDLKMREERNPHGMRIDFKAVENLLLEHGAKGPVLSPKPSQGPVSVW